MRGTDAKNWIIAKINQTFPTAFSGDGKEIRIPVMENGEIVEIKITMTCAKTNIGNVGEGEYEVMGTTPVQASIRPTVAADKAEPANVELTPQEKEDVAKMLSKLGL